MMNSTPGQQTALGADNRYVIFKVQVTRPSGSSGGLIPVDISDRIESVKINWDYERRNATCNLVIDNTDFIYSPKNTSSSVNLVASGQVMVYNPLIYPNRKLEVWMGFKTLNGDEFWPAFTGIMGDDIQVDSMPGKISLSARDMSKVLQDYYIYMSKSYDKLMAEQVISKMLEVDYAPYLSWDIPLLASGGPASNWYVNHFQLKDSNLWTATQQLADMMGWAFMFDASGKPKLWKPPFPSGTITPNITFDESIIIKDGYTLSDADIRNYILVKVQSPDSKLISVTLKNQDSITAHGLRFMEVNRNIASRIKGAENVRDLGLAILRDLSWPQIKEDLEIPLYPPLEPGDIIAINNSNTGLDSTTDTFRLAGLSHTITPTSKRTEIKTTTFRTISVGDMTPPQKPSGTIFELIESKVKWYPGSPWASGNQRVTKYPNVKWNDVTLDVSGNAIGNGIAGYTVYFSSGGSTGPWVPHGMTSAHLYGPSGTTISGAYYIDYQFPQASGGTGSGWYCVSAFTVTGVVSQKSAALQVTVPAPAIVKL